jgi:hypothetical protein
MVVVERLWGFLAILDMAWLERRDADGTQMMLAKVKTGHYFGFWCSL